ncbi:hypothetical protein DFH08DRAFT_968357 [Mycena albidolilacea]|uniref:F-box domain-containing protein n=1 Tax=Mycena albidolilacea TaxID=1033008 RepID=A0AAD7EHT3_9AGAR|nr:hypothetical protein DFH08DRAFT_968357 [Mycena albidolilacea]
MVPQELIDEIVDMVAECSPVTLDRIRMIKSLRHCALVSRSFRMPSQRCLFQKVGALALRQDNIHDVAAGLPNSLYLLPHIRDLHVRFLGLHTERNLPALTAIFKLLYPQIERFILSRDTWLSLRLVKCPDDFHSAILLFLSSPSLRCVGFFNCTRLPFPMISYLFQSKQEVFVKMLDDYELYEAQEITPELPVPSPDHPPLRYLYIEPGTGSLYQPLSMIPSLCCSIALHLFNV